MRRRVDMRAEGWWAGDLDVRQRAEDLPLLMRAASVDFVPTIVHENLKGKCQKNGRQNGRRVKKNVGHARRTRLSTRGRAAVF